MSHSAYSFWYVLGNKFVTFFANFLFNSWVGDLEICFKLLPLSLYRSLDIRSAGFGMEAEITGKLLRRGHRIYQVPIDYRARSREEGRNSPGATASPRSSSSSGSGSLHDSLRQA